MNVDTGELRLFEKDQAGKIVDAMNEGFVRVPKKHQKEAAEKLGDKKSVMVDMKQASPLTNWANKKREKKKHMAKIAKASKRRNRV
jgi:hypothetical protein